MAQASGSLPVFSELNLLMATPLYPNVADRPVSHTPTVPHSGPRPNCAGGGCLPTIRLAVRGSAEGQGPIWPALLRVRTERGRSPGGTMAITSRHELRKLPRKPRSDDRAARRTGGTA